MKIIKVSGTGGRRSLAEYVQNGIEDSWLLALERGDEEEEPATGEQIEQWLASCGVLEEGAAVVLDTNETFEGLDLAVKLYYTDAPFEDLDPETRAAAPGAGVVLIDTGPAFEAAVEGLESQVKEETGAGKVLIFEGDEGRERAFAKALDMTLSGLEKRPMPGSEVPRAVMDAVAAAASEGRMTCEKAHALAAELGVPLETVGRALDLAKIKITRCQLGCF